MSAASPAKLVDAFPREIVCRHAMRLPVSADRAWSLIGNLGDASIGAGLVERIDVDGSGVGAIRTLQVTTDIVLRERIEEYSVADRYYVYRVVDAGPLDFTHYVAMASVLPAGPGQCIVQWITMASAVDGRTDEVRLLLDGNIVKVFEAVERALGVRRVR